MFELMEERPRRACAHKLWMQAAIYLHSIKMSLGLKTFNFWSILNLNMLQMKEKKRFKCFRQLFSLIKVNLLAALP